jgi:hypothetical protein
MNPKILAAGIVSMVVALAVASGVGYSIGKRAGRQQLGLEVTESIRSAFFPNASREDAPPAAVPAARKGPAPSETEKAPPAEPLKVSIDKWFIGKYRRRGFGEFYEPKEPGVVFHVTISNPSKTKRKTYYGNSGSGFGKPDVRLTDELGNTYDEQGECEGGKILEKIDPEGKTEDVLVFDAPVPQAKTLTLTFSPQSIGGEAPVAFKLDVPTTKGP